MKEILNTRIQIQTEDGSVLAGKEAYVTVMTDGKPVHKLHAKIEMQMGANGKPYPAVVFFEELLK
ncbi:MAG: hypothetical protein EXS49_01685 [Candidatus Pacebacteria bacterium]|nr:hypothetical protein [Candidatus Paceibacterota bacterium]